MPKYKLTEGEARLLIAVFDHLKPYYEQAKAKHTSVVDEMNSANEKILETYYELLERALVVKLTTQELTVIKYHYGLSMDKKCYTFDEIAPAFSVKPERIHQIELEALRKIKRYMTELNSEETNMIIRALEIQAQEELENSTQAQEQGDSVSEEVYTHNRMVDTAVANKLRIQQDIRKYREKKE